MLIGVSPFYNRNRNLMMKRIIKRKPVFPDRKVYDIDYTDDCMDLVVKLLDKDKTKRLGCQNDVEEILSHPFFNDLDVVEIVSKTFTPPYKPEVETKLNV